jgi:pre-rRNA-processing protein TSR1
MDLELTGYVRGNAFSANRLVHLPGIGDFKVSQVLSANKVNALTDMEVSCEVLDVPDDGEDDLISENEPDDLMNEQTWPTDEEIEAAEGLCESWKFLQGFVKLGSMQHFSFSYLTLSDFSV